MTILAQKKLSAAAAEIKPIVGILHMFNSSNIAVFGAVRGRRRIIGKAMPRFYQRPPHLAVGKDGFVAI